MRGAIHKHSRAVMMPSRPNTVLNHGTPAYGYGPSGLPSISIRRSAAERVNHAVKLSLVVVIRHSSMPVRSKSCRNPRKAAGKGSNRLRPGFRSQETVVYMDSASFGSNVIWNLASRAEREAGRG